MMEQDQMRKCISTALFAGVMSILSQFTFPIGAVPITLQTFVCAMAGGVLGKKWGAAAIGLWLILGIFGVPVLTQGKAGPGIFFSPVGGYYLGFVLMAWICGFSADKAGRLTPQIAAAVVGLIACYALGTVYFMGYFQYGLAKAMPLWTAMTMTVFPFIPFDLVKIVAGVLAGVKVREALIAAGIYHRAARV